MKKNIELDTCSLLAIFSQIVYMHNLSRLVQVLGHESAELGSHRLSPARASAVEDAS